jgi:hypothetical protein
MDDLDMITLTRLPNRGWTLESGGRVVVAPDDPDRVADAVRAIVAALSHHSEHAGQCSECGAYRPDGRPPLLHRPGCTNAARAIGAALSRPRPLEWCEVHRVRHMKPGQGDPERDPCAGGRCSDPAAHAEGGHDV